MIRRMLLAALSSALAETPNNKTAHTYTIWGFDGTPYITRTLLPRIGKYRPLIHRIHREDSDPWMHNHPWSRAYFMIVAGGYVEERLVGEYSVQTKFYGPGSVNRLDASTFHRVVAVRPNTWTIGLVGERVQDWGFLVENELVQWQEYFRRKGKAAEMMKGTS